MDNSTYWLYPVELPNGELGHMLVKNEHKIPPADIKSLQAPAKKESWGKRFSKKATKVAKVASGVVTLLNNPFVIELMNNPETIKNILGL